MIMFTLNRNEIKLLATLNQAVNFFIGTSTFFIGILFTLLLTRISIPKEQYSATTLSIIFPWIVALSALIVIFSIAIALFISFKKKPEILGIIQDETDHR